MTENRPEDAIRGQILLLLSPADGSSAPGPTGVLLALQKLYPEVTNEIFYQHVDLLESLRLVTAQRAANGIPWVLNATAGGREEASEFARRRENSVARVHQLQDEYLHWLYLEIEEEDRSPSPEDYLATNPSFLGLPYTERELLRAGKRLRDAGFIEGPDTDQYDAPLRPALTAKGRRTIEASRSVHDEPQHGSVQNIQNNVAGNANINSGDHVTQNMQVHAPWAEQMQLFLDAVAQAAHVMPEEVRAELEPHVDVARKAVSEKEPSKVRAAMENIRSFLSSTTSGALGNVLASQVPALLALLG